MTGQFDKRALRTRGQPLESIVLPEGVFEAGSRAEIFANMIPAHEQLGTPEAYAEAISKLWSEAARKFLAIGEYLLQAYTHWRHGEKMERLQKMLPFSYQVANKLMRVAEAVRENRIPREQLPAHYPAAYALTRLSNEELQEARRRKLVRPDLRLAHVKAFIREVRQGETSEANQLRHERERIMVQVSRLQARLHEIDEKLRRLGEAPNDAILSSVISSAAAAPGLE